MDSGLGSPAVDSGIDVGLPFLGAAPDRGAFEGGVDIVAPVVTVPTGITAEATSSSGASVSFGTVSTTDNVGVTSGPTCGPASGSTFAIGDTTVTCSAGDAAGNVGSASFVVTVVDTTPPTLTVFGPSELQTIELEGLTGGGFTVYSEGGLIFTNVIPDFSAVIVDIDGDGDRELANLGFLTITIADSLGGSTFDVLSVDVDQAAGFLDINGVDLSGVTGTQSVGLFGVTSVSIVMLFGGAIDNIVVSASAPFADITVDATEPDGAIVEFQSFASDLVDADVAVTCLPLASGSVFPVGDTLVTCTATDDSGNSSDGSFTVTVLSSNQPPVAAAQDVTLSADAGCQATASVDDGSFDPDGDAITVTQEPPGPYALGDTSVTLTVTDSNGASDTASATVTVVDDTAPTLTATASPSSLWPPNHKYQTINLSVAAGDNCDAAVSVTAQVVSSEPDDAKKGDGKTTGDIRVTTAEGTVLLSSNANPSVAFDPVNDTLEVRGERSGNGTGRTYTISFTATDASGNATGGETTVMVPHDQGKKKK